ncbi:MAG: YihY/virulence factor BrkB family protein [Dermatophilus congolensis]|nr:YihY/virulence factor BrkB family protein [Dermatophilus congolensis]
MSTTTREKPPADSPESTTGGNESTEPSGAKKLIAVVLESRPVRAFQRYGAARGGLLAGGIAYSALFSIVAALTIAWTVFMATLGGNQALRGDVIRAVNSVLPGILDDGSGSGMVNPDSLVLDSIFNPASFVAALVLLWTAVSIMTNIRSGVQSMFGIAAPAENFALQKLRDLVGFVGMAIGIVFSSVLGTVAGTMGRTVLGAVGLGDNPVSGFLLRVLGFAVAAAVAAVTFACLFRVTAIVRPPNKDLWLGSAVGGVIVQIVLTLGTSLVSSVSDNPLLAASAGIATLLLFVNLLCRVLLLVAAFTANPPSPTKPESPEEVHFDETPNFVTLSAQHTLDWDYQGTTGQVQVDPALRPPAEQPYADARNGTARGTDTRPDGTPIVAEPLTDQQRADLIATLIPLEEKVVGLRARLGQRPRIEVAEKDYWARRAEIERRRTEA